MGKWEHNIGNNAEGYAIYILTAAGYGVSLPFVEHSRYDLIIEDRHTKKLYKVQVKKGTPTKDRTRIKFKTESTKCAAYVEGDFDYMGIHCPDNDTFHLVPFEDIDFSRKLNYIPYHGDYYRVFPDESLLRAEVIEEAEEEEEEHEIMLFELGEEYTYAK